MPIFYAANETFKNTIRFSVDLKEAVEPDAFSRAVREVQARYPYFSVRVQREQENFVLETNPEPFAISEANRAVCLNSPESNGHLLAFAFGGNTVSVDISHFICDGNGLLPLIKTLAYYYILERYGDGGVDSGDVWLSTAPVSEREYRYPLPAAPLPQEEGEFHPPKMDSPFIFAPDFFDRGGVYAYHLQIPQSGLMRAAKATGGSPVSFVCGMMYLATLRLFPDNGNDIVFQIPHNYREAIGAPLSHDCLARVLFAKLSPASDGGNVAELNAKLREQIAAGSGKAADVQAVNGLIQLGVYLETLPLAEKQRTMQNVVASALATHTFGVSYTGNVSWGGMEKYIADVHPYAGERERDSEISVEIFTVGDCFSLCVMQPGKNPAFARQLTACFAENGVPCTLRGEERYLLPDYRLP